MQAASLPQSRARQALGWLVFALAVGGLLAVGYGQVVTGFFLADDFNYLDVVTKAENIVDGTAINTGWIYFRPVTALSFWFNYLAFGKSATAFHLVSLGWHLVNACLVARLVLQMATVVVPAAAPQRARLGAWFGGGCFALLPLHPECVTWISARADIVCATGTLLCLSGWLAYLRPDGSSTAARALLLSAFGFVFALFAKGSAMVLPAILVLFALVHHDRSRRARWLPLLGAAVLFAAYFAMRLAVLGGFGGPSAAGGSEHLQVDLVNAARFTWDAALGMPLPTGTSMTNLAGLAIVTYLCARHGALPRLIKATWPLAVCFVIELAPVANTVQLNLADGTNARFLYLPALFFATAMGVLMATGPRGQRGWPLVLAGLMLLGIYVKDLRHANVKWREAAEVTEALIGQMRELASGKGYEYVFIHELPDNHRGVYTFRNGIEAAIRHFVDPALVFPTHGKIDRATWIKGVAQRRADPTAHSKVLLLRWDADSRRLITP